MSHKNYLLVGFAIALLTLCALPVKAQFEFGPTAGVGAVMDKPIQGAGLAADLGVSARYTFLKDAPVSIQLRLDATYGISMQGPSVRMSYNMCALVSKMIDSLLLGRII